MKKCLSKRLYFTGTSGNISYPETILEFDRKRERVTGNNFIVSLSPVIVAIPGLTLNNDCSDFRLEFSRTENKFSVKSEVINKISLIDLNLNYFRLLSTTSEPLNMLKDLKILLQNIYDRFYNNQNKLKVTYSELRKILICYVEPRPVYLVSYTKNGQNYGFPIDLGGNINDNYFIVSLSKNNSFLSDITAMKSVAVSVMSSKFSVDSIFKSETPVNIFGNLKSQLLNFPVPLYSIKVMELEKLERTHLGSHIQFYFKVISVFQEKSDENYLTHTSIYNC